jgi:hypothetical protein
MTYTLLDAIKASGNTGAAGQSFLSQVTGAVSGTGLIDYKIVGFSGIAGYPDAIFTYTNAEDFLVTFNVDRNAKYSNIETLGDVLILVTGSVPPGGSIVKSSSNIAGATGSFGVHIDGGVNTVGTFSGDTTYTTQYTEAHPTRVQIHFACLLSGGSSGGTSIAEFAFRYHPDIGPFNDDVWAPNDVDWYTAHMTKRAMLVSDCVVEWHNNSSYTSLAGTGSPFNVTSDAALGAASTTLYLRVQKPGSGIWNNIGAVTWTDPR